MNSTVSTRCPPNVAPPGGPILGTAFSAMSNTHAYTHVVLSVRMSNAHVPQNMQTAVGARTCTPKATHCAKQVTPHIGARAYCVRPRNMHERCGQQAATPSTAHQHAQARAHVRAVRMKGYAETEMDTWAGARAGAEAETEIWRRTRGCRRRRRQRTETERATRRRQKRSRRRRRRRRRKQRLRRRRRRRRRRWQRRGHVGGDNS